MTEVANQLLQEIRVAGPISFARFMQIALYCPKFGYYERPERVIGRTGDFYTSVSTGPLFGQLLALQFAEWLDEAGRAFPSTPETPRPLQLVEAGAHDGQLALDILTWLSQRRADLLARVEYCIIEPSPTRQQWQRHKLEKFAGLVKWFDSLSPSDGVRGIIFSNELLDAFPVHRLAWDAAHRTWFEWGVGYKDGQFVWEKITIRNVAVPFLNGQGTESSPFPPFCPPQLLPVLPDGFITDYSPSAAQWWNNAASVLHAGKLLTIDYGLTEEEVFTPQRAGGTLRSYYRHHLADPLSNPGDQDLTAHVNFSQLQRAGEAAGLRSEPLLTQAQFLVAIAEKFWTKESAPWPPALVRQFQTLTHPEMLGRKFRVLVQSR